MSITERAYDAIIVGSGPGGSSAVQELTARGLEVLLIDAGRELREEDFTFPKRRKKGGVGLDLFPRAGAMARGQVTQARRPYYNPLTNRFLVNDLQDPYTHPPTHPYLWVRGKLLGGRMHSYGRVLQRMSDVDFKAASADGYGDDWPLAYADLAPWYEKVEDAIGVYGDKDGLTHPPDGRYVGPGHLTDVETDFKERVEARWPERRVISWRCQANFEHGIPPGIAAAKATGRLTIRTEAEVTRIVTDDATGLATGVEFVDRTTKQAYSVRADTVVVAASTIESIRLLLNSGSARHPYGLGNSSGTLGRYFMDQTISIGFFESPRHAGMSAMPENMPADPFYGVPGGILIPRYENIGDHADASFLRGISFQGLGGRMPTPDGDPAVLGLGGAGEMLARRENAVTLSRVKDRWGMRVPHIDLTMSDNDRLLLKRSMTVLKEMGDEAGYRANFIGSAAGLESKKVWPRFNPVRRLIFKQGIKLSVVPGAAIHECGGARMGADPATSVVNGVNQLWDAPNVFVTDGASFVSSSTVGPALTIMALSARAGAFIADQHASGGLARPTEHVTY
ncbi:GMC family oxidoreductase [Demequina sp. SYSU T00192]|uniref:GMC family oxidoreductase n=1 Tax=Demequina litoralis TaxID=3051660 RepID=A0ABT8GAD0_9MICO|nr:GMC family oxidoreductase [Demequina sp. SYSU T00192]MDN4476090.1 GMC family oxidoreductase [Demequina sp. SYSU T00192]